MKRILAVLILIALVCAPVMATEQDNTGLTYRTLRWAIQILAIQMLRVMAVIELKDATPEAVDTVRAAIGECQRVLRALEMP